MLMRSVVGSPGRRGSTTRGSAFEPRSGGRMRTSVTLQVLLFAAGAAALAQSSGAISAGPSMATARSLHTATLLTDGTVLIAGGSSGDAIPVLNAEVYEPSTGTFTTTGPMIADSAGKATLLADGRVLLVGAQAQLYDPSTRTFAITGNSITTLGCAATLLGNGKVLFTDDPPPWGVPGELYNPATGTFELTGPYASAGIAQMNSAYFPAVGGWDCRRSTRLADGRVLIAGGFAAEIYDPQTNTFSLTGAVTTYPSGWVTNLPPWSGSIQGDAAAQRDGPVQWRRFG